MISETEKYAFSRPYFWSLILEKKEDMGILRYHERGKKPEDVSPTDFRWAAERLTEISGELKKIDPDFRFSVNIGDEEYSMDMELKGSLDCIAGSLALEFMQLSPRLRQMIKRNLAKMFLAGYFVGLIFGILAVAAATVFPGLK
jgi:hypothetical protein